jgi:hypothetical protein
VIVGDRESGKTTFLALLYAAHVKSGSARSDPFRFHAAHESLEEISQAFEQVMSGSFPDAATKEGIRGITYHLDSRPSGLGFLHRLRTKGGTSRRSVTLSLLLLRNLEEEMARYRKGSSFANATLRDVLEGDGIAVLVDSTNLGVGSGDPRHGATGRFDGAIESLLTALQRSRVRGGRKDLSPIFIFSKFDSVDPAALRAVGAEGPPPAIEKEGPRRAYAEALLKRHLPKTWNRIQDRDPRGLSFARPSFFFSSVRAEPAREGRSARIRLRATAGGGWEPDYSADEYLALVRHLWEIAVEAKT